MNTHIHVVIVTYKLQADTVCVCGSVIHQGEVDIDHRRISKGKIIKPPVKIPKEAYTK